jgi:hypothetical protein
MGLVFVGITELYGVVLISAFGVDRIGCAIRPAWPGVGGRLAVMADTVSDSVEAVLEELRGWAEQAEQAGRRLGGNIDEARLLLELLRDHLGVDVADLDKGDLEELLLEVYPRKVSVLEADDADDVIPTVRDLLAFCRDMGRLSKAKATRLEAELEGIEPRFSDAVMDPSRWGPARSVMQAMAADGVDFSDHAAVDQWISGYNAGLPALGGAGTSDRVGIGPYEEEVDLAEAFGLPDRLPPVRLPDDSELAEAARASGLLDRARRLAVWVGEKREVTDGYELSAADAADAAAVLGISADAFAHVWHFAYHCEFLSFHDTYVTAGPEAEEWPAAGDEDVLDTWQMALGEALSCGLLAGIDPDELAGQDLDFDGVGVAMVIMLFLARTAGVPAPELSEMVRETATAELPPAPARKSWQAWTQEHGDPARVLLERLRDLGAVEVGPPADVEAAEGVAGSDGEVARLSPLAIWALQIQLEEAGVDVPILPPVEEMTAADLIAVADGGTEEEVAAELAAWLELRSVEAAAGELLQAAAIGGAADRLFATALAARIGAAAEPQWRQALDDPQLGPYAKLTLARLAGSEPPNAPPGLEPTQQDLAWLLTDAIAATCGALEPGELADQLREALPPGERPQEILEVMWRLAHPDVVDVLTLIGEFHPDKKVAKAARKAVFKASSRASATR